MLLMHPTPYSDSHSSCLILFPVAPSHPEYYLTFSCHVSLCSFVPWWFPWPQLFWWHWQFPGGRVRYLVESASDGICLMFFSCNDTGVMSFGESNHRGKMPFLSHHIPRSILLTVDNNFLPMMLTLVIWLMAEFFRILCYSYSLCPLFHTDLFGRELTKVSLHLKSGSFALTLKAKNQHKWLEILMHGRFASSLSFICLLIDYSC